MPTALTLAKPTTRYGFCSQRSVAIRHWRFRKCKIIHYLAATGERKEPWSKRGRRRRREKRGGVAQRTKDDDIVCDMHIIMNRKSIALSIQKSTRNVTHDFRGVKKLRMSFCY